MNKLQQLHEKFIKEHADSDFPPRFSSLPYIDDTEREGETNWVVLGVHRETWRFDRLAYVYRTILNDAKEVGVYNEIRSFLLSLHDHKGWFTVTWVNCRPTKEMIDCVDFSCGKFEGIKPAHYVDEQPRAYDHNPDRHLIREPG